MIKEIGRNPNASLIRGRSCPHGCHLLPLLMVSLCCLLHLSFRGKCRDGAITRFGLRSDLLTICVNYSSKPRLLDPSRAGPTIDICSQNGYFASGGGETKIQRCYDVVFALLAYTRCYLTNTHPMLTRWGTAFHDTNSRLGVLHQPQCCLSELFSIYGLLGISLPFLPSKSVNIPSYQPQ